ncbi:MAG TPA: sigma-70 family RNA polymerase sigma factor [Acidimicrobiales bacterium]|nr:sigma-70 family RNA polymerase sigma factor [Acidimicrobiales bacterium]
MQVLPPDPPAAAGAAREPIADLPTVDFVYCYQSHYHRLVRALRLAGADSAAAEDAAQEAFARALVHWSRVSRGPNPTGYVYTAGFRLLAKAQRKAARRPPATAERNPPDPTGSAAASSVAIEAALAAMPPRRRSCAVMCLVVGLPVREAAEALGIAGGTVRKHLEDARRDLAAALA